MRLGKGINTITDNTTLRNFVQTIILSVCMSLSNNLSARSPNSLIPTQYPSELPETLASDPSDSVTITNNSETSEKVVDPDTIVNLVMDYLKAFKLTDSAKKEVEEILRKYLKDNRILVINYNNEVVFDIDNNDEFINLMIGMLNVIGPIIEKKINDMSPRQKGLYKTIKGNRIEDSLTLLQNLKNDFKGTVHVMPLKEYNEGINKVLKMVEGGLPLITFNKIKSRTNLEEVCPNEHNKRTYFPKQTAKL